MFSCLSNHPVYFERYQWWAMKGSFGFVSSFFWLWGRWFGKNAWQLILSPWSMGEVNASGMWLHTHKCKHSLWTCLLLTSYNLSYHHGEKLGSNWSLPWAGTFSESVLVTFPVSVTKYLTWLKGLSHWFMVLKGSVQAHLALTLW